MTERLLRAPVIVSLWLFALICLGTSRPALAAPEGLEAPASIVLAPTGVGRKATAVLSNPGAAPLTISSIGIRGRDWGGFVITDAHNPDAVPAGGRVELHIEVDPRAFEVVGEHGAGKSYRAGRAKLQVEASDGRHEVHLRFIPAPQPSPYPALLTFVLWCLVTMPLIAGRTPLPARRETRMLTLMAALTVLAALPLGTGWCDDPGFALAGELSRARCREGLGGGHLALVPASLGAWWLMAGLTALTALRYQPTRGGSDRERLLWLAAALVLAALSGGGWDLASGFGRSFAPRPGLALACLVAWATSMRTHPDRLSDLCWAATVVVVFAGGPRLPGLSLEYASPASVLAIGVAVIGLKLALLAPLMRWLSARPALERLRPLATGAGMLGFVYGVWS